MRSISEAISVSKINKIEIVLYLGDITLVHVDAIANAANSSLLGGGGVDGAIHRQAGKQLRSECQKLYSQGGCRPGQAKITTGGDLPAKYVIHTVGPVWNGGERNEAIVLGNCYKNSISLADKNKITSLIFPSISTGIFGYPSEKAALVGKEAILEIARNIQHIHILGWCLFDQETFDIYRKTWSL